MIQKQFISEIINYKKIDLGEVEELFLNIISHDPVSAYDILKMLKRDMRPMNYRNVHTRVKRLHALGLIKVQGKFKRNAIKYAVSSYGLFQLLLNGYVSPFIMNQYKDDIIFHTIIYEFFETGTIKKFVTIPRITALSDYARECCEAILKRLEEIRHSVYEEQIEFLMTEISDIIKDQIRKLAFQIITISSIKRRGIQFDYNESIYRGVRLHSDLDENENGPNYESLFPRPALNQDKKFINLLRELKADFDNGCKDFL